MQRLFIYSTELVIVLHDWAVSIFKHWGSNTNKQALYCWGDFSFCYIFSFWGLLFPQLLWVSTKKDEFGNDKMSRSGSYTSIFSLNNTISCFWKLLFYGFCRLEITLFPGSKNLRCLICVRMYIDVHLICLGSSKIIS